MALTRITQGVIKPNQNYDTHNINSTGIVTATGLNISGNASIGGVLTYEDVTNVDSIGIITARSDIKVGTAVTITSAGAGFYAGIVTASNFVKRDGSSVGGFTPSNSSGLTRGGTSSGSAGSNNTFFGLQAGQNAISSTQRCTAVGAEAFKLGSNQASNVTAMGWYALQQSSGNNNTGVGLAAFQFTTSGANNTGLGKNCGRFITIGADNTVIGCDVAQNLTEGSNNTLIGKSAEPSAATVSNEITLGDSNITKFRIPGIGVTFATGSYTGNHISGITTFADGRVTFKDDIVQHNGYHWYGFHGSNLYIDINASHWGLRASGAMNAFISANSSGGTTGRVHLSGGSSGGRVYVNGPGGVELHHSGSSDKKFETTSSGITVSGSVTDDKGNLRSLPQNDTTGTYTLVASDAGKHVRATGQITIPSGTFSTGDMITIYNNSGSAITIVQGSSTTVYNSNDASTGNKSLKARGLCTILCESNNAFVASGNFG